MIISISFGASEWNVNKHFFSNFASVSMKNFSEVHCPGTTGPAVHRDSKEGDVGEVSEEAEVRDGPAWVPEDVCGGWDCVQSSLSFQDRLVQ